MTEPINSIIMGSLFIVIFGGFILFEIIHSRRECNRRKKEGSDHWTDGMF